MLRNAHIYEGYTDGTGEHTSAPVSLVLFIVYIWSNEMLGTRGWIGAGVIIVSLTTIHIGLGFAAFGVILIVEDLYRVIKRW